MRLYIIIIIINVGDRPLVFNIKINYNYIYIIYNLFNLFINK